MIDLINCVFRTGRGDLPHTMEKEFPLLLTPKNRDNMRIIKDEDQIVSVVNFIPRKILVEGTPISTGSIGGVCTHSDYRGRGYSSKILIDVENRMKEIGVNLCIISSTRNLYKNWGAEEVKNCRRYTIFAGLSDLKFNVKEYEKGNILSLKKIYNSCGTRYLRLEDDFELLIESGTFPFGDTSYKKYVLEDKSGIRGYIILKKTPERVEVKEAVGDKNEIFNSLAFIGDQLGVGEIDYTLPYGELAPTGYCGKEENLSGVLKIIDFVGFMEELKPYFKQYLLGDEVEKLEFKEKNGRYQLSLGIEKLEIESHKNLLELIFEGKKGKRKDEKNIGGLDKFLDLVFPIPFIWTENLNYQ